MQHAQMVSEEATATDPRATLRHALHEAAHVLPAQGPIQVFVHHNTLHALQHLPFHEAIAKACSEMETHGYLTEDEYRQEHAKGRIDDDDLIAALDEHFEAEVEPPRVGPLSAREIRLIALKHPLEVQSEAGLAWQIDEHRALERMRADVPPDARVAFLERSTKWLREKATTGELGKLVSQKPARELEEDHEAWALSALFTACSTVSTRKRGVRPIVDRVPSQRSHGDLLRAVTGTDPAALVNPWLIRFSAAFLDRGMAEWRMPNRERGMLACFRELVTAGTLPLPRALARVRSDVRDQIRRGLDAEAVVLEALVALGVPQRHHAAYLGRVLLALAGWAGMVHRIEHFPEDQDPAIGPPSLMEHTAIQLTLDRAAWAHVAQRELGFDGPLDRLTAFIRDMPLADRPDRPAELEAAFRLFGLCQVAGIPADRVWAMPLRDRQAILDRLDDFDELTRLRIWQEAYERHYREQIMQALADVRRRRDPNAPRPTPRWQLSFCFDDREESLRRHIEELAPECETFGIAGFYGLAIEYRGLDSSAPEPLCPAGVTPGHAIHEVPDPEHETFADARLSRRGIVARLSHFTQRGSRALVRGTILTPLLGFMAAFPLTTRLLFPGLAEKLKRRTQELFLPAPRTLLTHTRDESGDDEVDAAKPRGFTLAEQIDRVAATLENMGMVRNFAPLVITLGHGSVSINNPHESAYNCGACSGRHGGPNGRLFAALCNRPEVRAGLRERNIDIPNGTWFVGGMHNTATDEITLYDLDRVPASHRDELAALQRILDEARARDAHERCRRFDDVPLDITPEGALRHVEGRVGDLSQVRPEYNHATVALGVVGRRELTRGLYLDRRAFVIAYDPTIDPNGKILERTLNAAGPVGSGISLEYYFSRVDNDRYGSGTKTPHNLAGLLGVMDGHASDLRTGLTAEMVEIHEPIRLLVVVESTPEMLLELAKRQPITIGELVVGGWMLLVCIHPENGKMFRFVPSRGAFEPWEPGPPSLPEVDSSIDHYRGRRDCVPPALVRDRSERSNAR